MATTHETPVSIPAGTEIVVGADGSDHSERAVAWAAEEALARHRPLTVVHVEQTIGSQERGWLAQAGIPAGQVSEELRRNTADILHRARTLATTVAAPIETDAVRYVGDARAVLLDLAERADMIVLGSRGRGPVSSLVLGSVSVAVSRPRGMSRGRREASTGSGSASRRPGGHRRHESI